MHPVDLQRHTLTPHPQAGHDVCADVGLGCPSWQASGFHSRHTRRPARSRTQRPRTIPSTYPRGGDMLTDQLAARIRTAWPMVLGYLAARLLVYGAPVADWLHSTVGLEVTEPQVAAALGVVLGYGIYEAGRWLERRDGAGGMDRVARGVGRFLLSLGLRTGQPVYALPGQRVRVLGADGSLRPPR